MKLFEMSGISRQLRNALLTFLLVGVLGLSTYDWYSWQREERDTYDYLRILSSFLATTSQSFFDDLGNGLAPLGELLDQIAVRNHPQAARQHLLNFMNRHPQVRAVAVFSAKGEMLVNTAVKAGQPLPNFRKDPPYIKQLMQDMSSPARYTVGPPEFGKAIKLWRFSVRHVVRDGKGKAKFLVQAAIPLEKEGTFLHQLPVPPHSHIGLLRADGYQQARHPEVDVETTYGRVSQGPAAAMILQHPGLREGYFKGASPWVEGDNNRIGYFSKLAKFDMYAYVSVPASFLRQRWWQHNEPVLISFVFFFAAFVMIAYRISKREGVHSRELLEMARRDVLTGLPNRESLGNILDANMRSAMAGQRKFAILFLDLDRFKGINDTFGHAIGDKLLIRVAQTIRPLLRGGDVLGRFGGDEFLLVMPGSNESGVMLITQRILDTFKAPFDIDGSSLRITPSIGIAIYPDHGDDIETLLKHADTAMYESKRLGRNAYTVYMDQMGRRVRDRLEMEHQLRDALQHDAFRLLYQPIVDMHSGEIVSMEALVRWVMPDGTWRLPGEFIHVVEDSGMIIPLGEWVLRTACVQLKKWLLAGFDLKVAVNLSTRQFQDPGLMAKVLAVLHDVELDATRLELEVTESAAMLNPDESVEILCAFTEKGIRIAIDDFGTGYSSLSYLKRIPAHTIKIDKMFVDGLGREVEDATIVRTVIALAHALEKETVAEGIETEEQFTQIRAMGSNFAQGFLISVPLDAEALTSLLAKSTKLINIA
ncbi:MAG: EAL domain-containing protein [Gallionellaceae bacterium]|jgi:diguanylate cyclase (GGDEF)-like protein